MIDGLTSPASRRAYAAALAGFLSWSRRVGRPLTKASVQAYRAELIASGASAATINLRLSAIRKLAAEASDNALLAPEISTGIAHVPGVRREGQRLGNWLALEQAQQLLEAPDPQTLRGKRDRAILAVLLGCGLRRAEAVGSPGTELEFAL